MPSRRNRRTAGPTDVEPIFHGGGGSFTGNADLNQASSRVVLLEGRLLDLETKRLPDIEKDLASFKARIVGAGGAIAFVVGLISMIAAILALKH
jgi:hypothetical protein